MDMNFVVGGLIALIVALDVIYIVRQRRKGVNGCGCTGCSGCGGRCSTGPNVTFDQSGCENRERK